MQPNKNRLLSVFDYFFVLRPILFFPGWSTLLAGFLIGYSKQLVVAPEIMAGMDFFLIIKLMVVFAASMGGCFLLNQLRDVESDRENNKLFIVAEGYLSKKSVRIEVALLLAGATALAFSISRSVGIFVLLFNIITGYLYNYRPFRLKDFPWGSLAANSAMGWLAFAIGWAGSQKFNAAELFSDSLPYLFFNTALYFYTTLPDVDGDSKANKRTLAVAYGLKNILILSFILYVLALVSAIWQADSLALFFIVLSGPFFILTLRNNDVAGAVRTTKFSILFFALAVCLKLPAYFALMAGLFFFTKWYFKARFNFDYPNFKGRG